MTLPSERYEVLKELRKELEQTRYIILPLSFFLESFKLDSLNIEQITEIMHVISDELKAVCELNFSEGCLIIRKEKEDLQ